jgi:hypothetical protein
MSLMDLFFLLRKVPVPVRELVVLVVRNIVSDPNPADAARRALEATRTKALDEVLRGRFG